MPNELKPSSTTIMDIDFVNMSKSDLLQTHLYPRLDDGEKTFLVTANPEIVMQARENAVYKQILRRADFVTPDGTGIVMASKYVGDPVQERIPGFDLMQDLLQYADEKGLACYFLGAKEYVVDRAVVNIKETYPSLVVAGSHHGYFSDDEGVEIARMASEAEPDVIFAALGSPRQEKWITENWDLFSKGLFMGVGGSFDVLAGEVKRAPDAWIKLNLEWLYRLLKQPLRWRRILTSFKFMFLVLFRRK